MKRNLIAAMAMTTMLVAGGALAQGGGRGNPGGGPGGGPAGGGNAIVAADGTVFVTRIVTDSGTNTSTTQLRAITPAGVVAWTITLSNRGHLTLSGNNLLTVSEPAGGDGTATSTITAISASTGAVAWTRTLNGRVTDLEPFSGGTYAIVVTPPATSGGTATRSLVSISNSGIVNWTVSLT